jgi:hypothetical protein
MTRELLRLLTLLTLLTNPFTNPLATTLSAFSRTLTTNALSLLSYQPPQPPQPPQPTIYIYIYIYIYKCQCVCARMRVYLPSATHALRKRVHAASHDLDLRDLDKRHTSHAPLDSQRLPHSFPHKMSRRFALKIVRHRVRALCEHARTMLQASRALGVCVCECVGACKREVHTQRKVHTHAHARDTRKPAVRRRRA